MRIAVSGTHRVGKTTLLEELSARLPGYRALEEPYQLLEDEGYEFSDPPTVEDFERQLRRSLQLLEELAEEGRADVLLDRCPLDFVAYLRALDEDFEIDEWLPELREAMEAIDLIVVVPIEAPDRIAVAAHEDKRLRRAADEQLQTLVLDDPHDLGVGKLEVRGEVDERVRQVLRAMR